MTALGHIPVPPVSPRDSNARKGDRNLLDDISDVTNDFKDDAAEQLTDVKDDATTQLTGIEDDLAQLTHIQDTLFDQVRKALGLSDWYSLYISSSCEGSFGPDGTARNAGYNTTNCTTRRRGGMCHCL